MTGITRFDIYSFLLFLVLCILFKLGLESFCVFVIKQLHLFALIQTQSPIHSLFAQCYPCFFLKLSTNSMLCINLVVASDNISGLLSLLDEEVEVVGLISLYFRFKIWFLDLVLLMVCVSTSCDAQLSRSFSILLHSWSFSSSTCVVFTPLNTYYSYEITQILYKK